MTRAAGWGGARARRAYVALAWTLVVGIAVQVFLAGWAVMGRPEAWLWHMRWVHGLELLTWILALVAWLGKGPRRAVYLPLVVFGLIWLQYVFIHLPDAALRALHPTNALLIFAVALLAAVSQRGRGAAA